MFGTIAAFAGPIIGASMQSDAAKSAAQTQADATAGAIGEQRRQFDLTRSDTAPYRASGRTALSRLQALLGMGDRGPAGTGALTEDQVGALYRRYLGRDPGPEEVSAQLASTPNAYSLEQGFRTTPEYQQRVAAGNPEVQGYIFNTPPPSGAPTNPADMAAESPLLRKFSLNDFWQDPVTQASYQSGLDLGTKALKNAAPLTTGLDSGAALKELTKFGTDYTGQQAAGSQARFVGDQTNSFNKLMAMIGGGQVATQQAGQAGQASAANIGALGTAGANAQGAARIAGANAWGGALNNISSWWNQNQMLDKLKGMIPGGGFGGGIWNWATPNRFAGVEAGPG